jgi:L-arabinonolactonase
MSPAQPNIANATGFAPLGDQRHGLAEGVLWDEAAGVLWWTDIPASRLWQFDPRTRNTRQWEMPERLGCFALTHEAGVLLLGLEQHMARFDTASGQLDMLCDVEPELPHTRVNDGRCDRHGNFIFGTLNEASREAIGSFYRYQADGRLHRLELPKVAISNSLCFSPDGATLYFCDSPSRRIMACDYDGATGEVDRIRVFTELPADGGVPDGSTVDADGFVWNAQWDASRVARYAPDGRLDRVIAVSASQTSCVSFAGAGLDCLAITSARVGLSPTQLDNEPDAGAVFWGSAPVSRGIPESRFGQPDRL